MSGGTLELKAKAPAQDLKPPIMEVGFNYAWLTNNYGTCIGPGGFPDVTPPAWRRSPTNIPFNALADNLKTLRDDLNIKKVRMFLLCNAMNYGPPPTTSRTGIKSWQSIFKAPSAPDPLFFDHFRQMLQDFKNAGMQILPSLIDFGAFYPHSSMAGGAGGGRTTLLTSQRKIFIDTMLRPLLAESKKFADSVYAWEVVNEPVWNTCFFARPHTDDIGHPDANEATMTSFISDCLRVIEGEGFKSTVGHRYLPDVSKFGGGTLPQFHYYGSTGFQAYDPDPIPDYASLSGAAKDAFVGELGAGPKDPGKLWPECKGRDALTANASYIRLRLLAYKGYKLAFVWPDTATKSWDDDPLKLTPEARASIRMFTKGLFPGGVPDTPLP